MVHQRMPSVPLCTVPVVDDSFQRKQQRCEHPHCHSASIQTKSTDIVRLLFLVPIYASISFASFLFWVRSTGQSLLISLNRATDRITLRPSYLCETVTKASSSPHSFTFSLPTFLRIRRNKRKFFASTDYLTRMIVNARGEARNLRNGFGPSALSSPSQR